MKLDALFPIAQDLAIVFPTGEGTGITLKVVGPDSTQFRSTAAKIKQQEISSDRLPTVDETIAMNAELISSCVVGWSGIEDADGSPMQYSAAKALEVLTKVAFMREQVEVFVSKRAQFFRKVAPDA